jgi:hypothetical protein
VFTESCFSRGLCDSFFQKLFSSDEVSGTPKGILLLNKNSSVQRTKNQRDGFHFCIRLDSLESSSSCSPSVKQWSKLVMILRSEAELTEWIRVIRSVVSGDMVTSVNRNSFLPPNVLSDNMVVYQGKGLKEVCSSTSCFASFGPFNLVFY